MARTLNVYLFRQLVGNLVQDNHGDIEFGYADSWLCDPNSIPLSRSLPLRREHYTRRECRGFFGGILPEGENRTVIARNLGISARNDFAMLELIGGECAGAITFIQYGEALPEQRGEYHSLTDEELANILRLLPRHPLLAGQANTRLSLAGAQDKIAVCVTKGGISIPLGGSPSTHILKRASERFHDVVHNEWLCMKLARAIGLQTAAASIGSVEGIEYLLVERYDRLKTEGGSLERLHQEDFCQALGIASERKYQSEGGPSLTDCFALIRETSSIPIVDLLSLLNAVIFNYLIGNNDAHAKNFSLLYVRRPNTDLQIRLAPLYDLLCTAIYPELSPRMAMKIGGEDIADSITITDFERFAEDSGLGKPMVKRRIHSLAQSILASLTEVAAECTEGTGVSRLIRDRCERAIRLL